MTRQTILRTWLFWILFVVYGSLLPFEHNGTTFAQAVERFSNIPYLDLGVVSRADWVANILLYIPMSYLGLALFGAGDARRLRSPVAVLFVLLACLSIAVGVEFAQTFIRPRTVSQNDLIAEAIGTGLGIAIWIVAGAKLTGLWSRLWGPGGNALRAAAVIYGLGYVLLALFPFDFVLSGEELAWKIQQGNVGWFLVAGGCANLVHCLLKITAEVLVILPLGMLYAILRGPRNGVFAALSLGLAIGLVIEGLQFFLASGTAQGVSVFNRGLGVALGWLLWHWMSRYSWAQVKKSLIPAGMLLAPLYPVTVAAASGWFSSSWHGISGTAEKFDQLSLLPFYYHYFTTETSAMMSLLSVFGLYVPLGVVCWAYPQWRTSAIFCRMPYSAGVLALGLALVVEVGKLFVLGSRPDPTNVIIAVVAATVAFRAMYWLDRRLAQPVATASSHGVDSVAGLGSIAHAFGANGRSGYAAADTAAQIRPTAPPASATHTSGGTASGVYLARTLALLLWLGAVVAMMRFPVLQSALVLGYAVTAFWISRHPRRWPIPIVVGLVLLNLAPWSGRYVFDAFDILILVVLGAVSWGWRIPRQAHRDRVIAAVLGLAALSYLISLVVGLWPPAAPDLNALYSYMTPFNALRVGKGFFWACCLILPWLVLSRAHMLSLRHSLSSGMLIALAGLAAVVMIEREMYFGLFDFTTDFRVTGTFWGMHTGGAYLDGFLVAALPFLLGMKMPRRIGYRVLSALLWAAAVYAIMVTYSRGLYLAAVVALVIYTVARLSVRHVRWRVAPKVAVGALLAVLVIVPILQGGYVASRFGTLERDTDTRLAHWGDALSMMASEPLGWLFGVGLGAYPRSNFWFAPEKLRPTTYALGSEQGRDYLRLGSGTPAWLDQRIGGFDGTALQAKVTLRGQDAAADLVLFVCEKSLLYTAGCSSATATVPGDGAWHEVGVRIDAPVINGYTSLLPRPVVLSLRNPHAGSVVDIDRIVLEGPSGSDLLHNGDFTAGLDHWYFASDEHLAWHTKNLILGVFFDQGLLGVVALFAVLGVAGVRLLDQLRRGDDVAAVYLASLTGLFTLGVVDSLFDEPRMSLLFYLIALVSMASVSRPKRPGKI